MMPNKRSELFKTAKSLGYRGAWRQSTIVLMEKFIKRYNGRASIKDALYRQAKQAGLKQRKSKVSIEDLEKFINPRAVVVKKPNQRSILYKQVKLIGWKTPFIKSKIADMTEFANEHGGPDEVFAEFKNVMKRTALPFKFRIGAVGYKQVLTPIGAPAPLPPTINKDYSIEVLDPTPIYAGIKKYNYGTGPDDRDQDMWYFHVSIIRNHIFDMRTKDDVKIITREWILDNVNVKFVYSGVNGDPYGEDSDFIPPVLLTAFREMGEHERVDELVSGFKADTVRYDMDFYFSSLFAVIEPNYLKLKPIRFAELKCENCVVNVLRNYRPAMAKKIYAKFPGLNPAINTNEFIYMTDIELAAIADMLKVRVQLYTPLGSILDEPWVVYGPENTKLKRIEMVVAAEHATIRATKVKIGRIVYVDGELSLPNDTNVVEHNADYKSGNLSYYVKLEGKSFVIYKKFKPSSITRNSADDSELLYARITDSGLLLYKKFLERYEIDALGRFDNAYVKDDTIENIVAQSENFIGRSVFESLIETDFEIDHNRSYASYKNCEYYIGFPKASTLYISEYNAVKTPAFIVLKSVPKNASKGYYSFFANRLVITYPVFKYLLSIGAELDIDYVLEAAYDNVDVLEYAAEVGVDVADRKLFINSLFGRLITGGLAETRTLKCHYKNNVEREQLLAECSKYKDDCDKLEIPFSYKCLNGCSKITGSITEHATNIERRYANQVERMNIKKSITGAYIDSPDTERGKVRLLKNGEIITEIFRNHAELAKLIPDSHNGKIKYAPYKPVNIFDSAFVSRGIISSNETSIGKSYTYSLEDGFKPIYQCAEVKSHRFGRIVELTKFDIADKILHYEIEYDMPVSGDIVIEMKQKKPRHMHFHSFILGYSSVQLMQTWDKLEQYGASVVAYNVDALGVRLPGNKKFKDFKSFISCYDYEVQRLTDIIKFSDKPGDWKMGELKPYYFRTTLKNMSPLIEHNIPRPKIYENQYTCNTLISGAPGIGKSYPFLKNPHADCIILTPTRELRKAHRATIDALKKENPDNSAYDNVRIETAHKYFRFDIAEIGRYLNQRKIGTITPAAREIIIDEYTMYNKSQWEIIMDRSKGSIIIALGDFNQICTCIDADPIDRAFFVSRKFNVVELERTPETKARQEYDFGSELDTFRDMSVEEQVLKVYGMWGDAAVNESDLIEHIKSGKISKIIVGNHKFAQYYNKLAREHLPGLFPFKTIGRTPKLIDLPVDTPNVYWDRTLMYDKPPSTALYEPAFASTADSIQGKTTDGLAVHVESLQRPGTLYTAITRCTKMEELIPIKCSDAFMQITNNKILLDALSIDEPEQHIQLIRQVKPKRLTNDGREKYVQEELKKGVIPISEELDFYGNKISFAGIFTAYSKVANRDVYLIKPFPDAPINQLQGYARGLEKYGLTDAEMKKL